MSKRMISLGVLWLGAAMLVAVAPPALASDSTSLSLTNTAVPVVAAPSDAIAADPDLAVPAAARVFPSSTSTVVGSVVFIDADEAGYFWSAARGDRVAETFSGPARVRVAVLKLDVVANTLCCGATVDWTVSINGTDVGQFQVTEGQTGPLTVRCRFPRITGGTYAVDMRVTNEVAGGEGRTRCATPAPDRTRSR